MTNRETVGYVIIPEGSALGETKCLCVECARHAHGDSLDVPGFATAIYAGTTDRQCEECERKL